MLRLRKFVTGINVVGINYHKSNKSKTFLFHN